MTFIVCGVIVVMVNLPYLRMQWQDVLDPPGPYSVRTELALLVMNAVFVGVGSHMIFMGISLLLF